jgi:hypothetical protein
MWWWWRLFKHQHRRPKGEKEACNTISFYWDIITNSSFLYHVDSFCHLQFFHCTTHPWCRRLWHSSGLHNNISIISKIQAQFSRNLHVSRIQTNIYKHTRYQRSSP